MGILENPVAITNIDRTADNIEYADSPLIIP